MPGVVAAAPVGAGAEAAVYQVVRQAGYQEDFSAEQAVDDLVRLDGLSEGQLALRLWTPRGAAPGERRLTVYRVGERLLLSEVLPVLQNMGVDVVDERPYEIDRIGAPPTWIYDFGVSVPAVELPLLRSLPERFTVEFDYAGINKYELRLKFNGDPDNPEDYVVIGSWTSVLPVGRTGASSSEKPSRAARATCAWASWKSWMMRSLSAKRYCRACCACRSDSVPIMCRSCWSVQRTSE